MAMIHNKGHRKKLTRNSFASRSIPIKQADKDLMRIKERLAHLVPSPEIHRWLAAPNARLGGRTPQQLIDAGATEEVLNLIIKLEEGLYA
jgi:hypothetical protein